MDTSVWPKLRSLAFVLALCACMLAGCAAAGDDGDAGDRGSASAAASAGSYAAFSSDAYPDDVPAYSGEPYAELGDMRPDFTEADFETPYGTEVYGELDSLGRCTFAFAMVGPETQTDEPRDSIREIKPSGWVQNVKLPGLDHLYERSHLIAYRLTAENANERNLITGTHYMNQGAMKTWEDEVASYVNAAGGHVLMRVTPRFEGDELVARGVRMEAASVEDGGESVCFDVYCYNVQPGVAIDYATGQSWAESEAPSTALAPSSAQDGGDASAPGGAGALAAPEGAEAGAADPSSSADPAGADAEEQVLSYVINTRSKRFHTPDCPGAASMSGANGQIVEATRSDLIDAGYVPCGTCEP